MEEKKSHWDYYWGSVAKRGHSNDRGNYVIISAHGGPYKLYLGGMRDGRPLPQVNQLVFFKVTYYVDRSRFYIISNAVVGDYRLYKRKRVNGCIMSWNGRTGIVKYGDIEAKVKAKWVLVNLRLLKVGLTVNFFLTVYDKRKQYFAEYVTF